MNIKQVAKAAGVSVATISRVMNHPENVAPKTREKITKVMQDHGYKPNWFAQGLNSNMTKTIGLIIPHILNPTYMEIAKGVEDIAVKKEYTTFMCNAENNKESEKEYIEKLITRRVDGIIIMFTTLSEEEINAINSTNIPIVLIGENKKNEGFNIVKANCRTGAQKIMRSLTEIGYKDIAILYGNDPEQETLDMIEGYKDALKERNIKPNEDYIKKTMNTIEGGYLGAKKLLEENSPRAIFATSDEIAYGVLDATKQLGIKVPEELAIAGFGNSRMSNLVDPKLTTVELPFHMMGTYGARLMFDLIEDNELQGEKPKEIILQTKLKIRKSCGHTERIGEMF